MKNFLITIFILMSFINFCFASSFKNAIDPDIREEIKNQILSDSSYFNLNLNSYSDIYDKKLITADEHISIIKDQIDLLKIKILYLKVLKKHKSSER